LNKQADVNKKSSTKNEPGTSSNLENPAKTSTSKSKEWGKGPAEGAQRKRTKGGFLGETRAQRGG